MSGGDIPAHIRAFIARSIRSVVDLESLLLLRSHPGRVFNAVELGRELRIDEKFARQEMADLIGRGLAVAAAEGIGCRYGPQSPEVDRTVEELAELYATRRVSMIQVIYSRPPDAIQNFADAFKLRKDAPND